MLILLFILTLGILIVGHEFGHFIVAKLFKLRVDEFGFGFPPKIISKRFGETKYSLNLIPFGGFVKIYGEHPEAENPDGEPHRSFYNQTAAKRVAVIAAGVIMNFIIGWVAFSFVFMAGIPHAVYIQGVAEGSPAAEAGLRAGDKLLGFQNIDEFKSLVDANLGKTIIINGKEVTPRFNPPEGEGALGVSLDEGGIEKQGIIKSFYSGFTTSIQMIGQIFIALGNLIGDAVTGGGETLKNVVGPVGIFNFFGKTSELGFTYIIQFLGVLSINLTVFNLLPIPALDGGRLFFIIIEKIVKRRLNHRYESAANALGFIFLILLAVIVTVSDINKLI